MFATHSEFLNQGAEVGRAVKQFMEKHHLQSRVVVDHICFKAANSATYDFARQILEDQKVSRWSQQQWVSGRRVSYLQLWIPIRDEKAEGFIRFVELQDADPTASIAESEAGFHHVEICPMAGDYENLCKDLAEAGETVIHKNRVHHKTHDIILPPGLLPHQLIIRISRDRLVNKITADMQEP